MTSPLRAALCAGALLMACGPADAGPDAVALQVLAGAERAVQGADPEGPIPGLHTVAEVTGPGYTFQTTLWSAPDGRARMEQTTGFAAGVSGDSGWVRTRDGRLEPIDPDRVQYLWGHELHALVLLPLSRLAHPRMADTLRWPGGDALVVEFRNRFDRAVFIAYDRRDTLPLGLLFTDPDPDVAVALHDWSEDGYPRLFRAATFTQDGEVFEYRYTSLTLAWLPASLFQKP